MEEGKGGINGIREDLTLVGEHTIQHSNDVNMHGNMNLN